MASNFNKSTTAAGLGTIDTTKVPDAGTYIVEGKITLPSISNGSSGNSAVIAVINKNGSPAYTGLAGAEGFYSKVPCAASDILTIVLSSSAPVDLQVNVIKSTIAISLAS